MKMFVSHPNQQKGEQQGNFQNCPHSACQPESEGLHHWICKNNEDCPHKLSPGHPPGSDDIPQQKTDKGVIKKGVGVGVMSNFLFQQQQGDPADKNQEEQSRHRPGQPQQQAAGQSQEDVLSTHAADHLFSVQMMRPFFAALRAWSWKN